MTDTVHDLLAVLRDFGADWQILHDRETGIWTAVAYPTPTAQHILVARDLTELAVKLEGAQRGSRQPGETGLTITPPPARSSLGGATP